MVSLAQLLALLQGWFLVLRGGLGLLPDSHAREGVRRASLRLMLRLLFVGLRELGGMGGVEALRRACATSCPLRCGALAALPPYGCPSTCAD